MDSIKEVEFKLKHEKKVQLDKDSNPLSTCVMVLPE